MQLKQGTLLQGEKYKIERVLGQGGFGITYLATQDILDRKVAIKEFFFKEYCERNEDTNTVTLGTQSNKTTVERFLKKFIKEAKTISALHHPNIIQIHDIFRENNTAYYVMEYIEGMSLGELVKVQGSLSESKALEYIKKVANALDYIHARHINHLDVKPSNIMLRQSDEEVILIDFGVAKQYDENSKEGSTTTPVGISKGYSPNEQYMLGGVQSFSPQSDVYALAATLFKLLTSITPPEAAIIIEDGIPQEELKERHIAANIISAIEHAMRSKRMRTQSISIFLKDINSVGTDSEIDSTILNGTAVSYPENRKNQSIEKKTDRNVHYEESVIQPAQVVKEEVNSTEVKSGFNLYKTALWSIIVIVGAVLFYFRSNGDSTLQQVGDCDSIETYTSIDKTGKQPRSETEKVYVETNGNNIYVVTKNMFVRTGPGTEYDPKYSPYNDFDSNNTNGVVVYAGTTIKVLRKENGFVYAEQQYPNNDRDEWVEGWISMKHIEKK